MFRSLLFSLYFPLWTGIVALSCLPLFLLPMRYVLHVGTVWAHGTLWGVRLLCGVRYEIRGREHLPKQGGYMLVSKHQSTFETVLFLLMVPKPAFVLKKELLRLPLYGAFLYRMGMIAIDRQGGANALKKMLKQAKERLEQGRTIIIFPEGTRALPGQRLPYQAGVAALYSQCQVPIIPVALNTGLYWPRNSYLKRPGTIIIECLPPIQPGLAKGEFMELIESQIEDATKDLIAA